jgi:ketosteroid isomerase-like protein
VQTGPDHRLALIRRYYQAYENDDQSAIERLLHPGFTFTSPEDRCRAASHLSGQVNLYRALRVPENKLRLPRPGR